ncbi:MAG: glycosyltransferase family 2 protein [Flavitalea sp.]
MRISVITAAYNSASTIADTLRSVAQQDYPDIEHIIIDGGSRDDTMGIVIDFLHVKLSISEEDKGIYDAMNKGIKRATGDIIAILNSDDFYSNSSVLSSVASLFEDPQIDAVYGDLQYVKQDNTNIVSRYWKAGKFSASKFYYGWMPPHPSFFVRRKVYDQVGLFNTTLRTSADYELMLRILVKHKMKAAYLPSVLVKMREGGLSNSSLSHRIKANKEDRLAWKLNGLQPNFFTLYLKPIRKIFQFIFK